MDIRCPFCSYAVSLETEKDAKNQLMQHCQTTHKMNKKEFEIMYNDMRELAMVFTPPISKSK